MHGILLSGLVLIAATWICWISFRNGYKGLLVLYLLPLLNLCLLVVAALCLFSRYYFCRYSPKLVPVPNRSNKLHDVAIIPRCRKAVQVTSFFFQTARPWNSLPAECFPLTDDLNGFSPQLMHTCRFSLSFSASFSCNFLPSGCLALHGVNPNWKTYKSWLDACYKKWICTIRKIIFC